MGKVFLIVMIVSGNGTHDFISERMDSEVSCQAHGREFSESLLAKVPDVRRVSFKCKEAAQ
ncbi:hypothetical protein [Sinorhizobium medicae]